MQRMTYRVAALMLFITSLWTVPVYAVEPKAHRPAASEIWARTELYFGSERPGGEVKDAEFSDFGS